MLDPLHPLHAAAILGLEGSVRGRRPAVTLVLLPEPHGIRGGSRGRVGTVRNLPNASEVLASAMAASSRCADTKSDAGVSSHHQEADSAGIWMRGGVQGRLECAEALHSLLGQASDDVWGYRESLSGSWCCFPSFLRRRLLDKNALTVVSPWPMSPTQLSCGKAARVLAIAS
jgi:hypothetical protein